MRPRLRTRRRTGRRPTASRHGAGRVARRPGRAARPRAARGRTSSAGSARRTVPDAGVRRAGRRPGAGRRRPHRAARTGAVHSLHSYFIRPGRPARADRLRGRPDPRRPVVHHPAGAWRSSTARRSSRCPRRSSCRRAGRGARRARCRRRAGAGVAADLGERLRRVERPAALRAECRADRRALRRRRRRGCRGAGRPGRGAQRVWMRADGMLPDDPLLHVCMLTYASDLTLLDSVLAPHGAVLGLDRSVARAWTTRCGSTGRSGPTSGCSTTAARRARPGARGLATGRSSPGTGG